MQRGLRVITLQGAIEKSPILLLPTFIGPWSFLESGNCEKAKANNTCTNSLKVRFLKLKKKVIKVLLTKNSVILITGFYLKCFHILNCEEMIFLVPRGKMIDLGTNYNFFHFPKKNQLI